MAVIA